VFGYRWRACAENIYKIYKGPGSLSPGGGFAWMRSPSHKPHILDQRFDEVGVGATIGTFRNPSLAQASISPNMLRNLKKIVKNTVKGVDIGT
jgi:uncharacterized protein YkwD